MAVPDEGDDRSDPRRRFAGQRTSYRMFWVLAFLVVLSLGASVAVGLWLTQHADESTRTAVFALVALSLTSVGLLIGTSIYGARLGKRAGLSYLEREAFIVRLQEAEARTRSVFDTAADGILTFDENGLIESANQSAARLFGYADDSLLGTDIAELVPQSDSSDGGAVLIAADPPSGVRELQGKRATGSTFPIELSVGKLSINDRLLFTAVVRDITRRKTIEAELRQEEALRQSEERFRSLVQHTSDIILVLDSDGLTRYASPSVERSLGLLPSDIVGVSPTPIKIHPDDVKAVARIFKEVIVEPEATRSFEFRCRHRDGSWRSFEAIMSNLLATPSVNGVAVSCRDITERKAFEQQLTHQAFHDALTGLPNRLLFQDRIERALAGSVRRETLVGILFFDIDNFKDINDSLGHPAGDRLLVSVAERVRLSVRDSDTVARLGGDEFTVLMEDLAEPAEAERIADRILDIIRTPFQIDGKELFITTSVGVALSDVDGCTPAEILGNADVALYQAKARGKGRWERFKPEMREAVVERVTLEADLRRAIERNELVVHYQPVVNLDDQQIVGVEALVRWNHPTKGLIPPARFIGLAEETGLIVPIGEWVLREACAQGRRWQLSQTTKPPLEIAVNLSPRQLLDAHLIDKLTRILVTTGLPAASLVLEVTEEALVHDTEQVMTQIEQLKLLGIRLAIDDFGTGYSSLGYLQRLPFDILKIDRTFVNAVAAANGGDELVDAMVKMGRSLGMSTVAEGVERLEQFSELRNLGCDLAQGFYFAKPASAEAIEASYFSSPVRSELPLAA